MKVYGIDFTSALSRRKPITCADCTLENGLLHFNDIMYLETFEKFDEFFTIRTKWIAGMDFPFGQPRKLIYDLEWPSSWKDYVGAIDKMGKEKFKAKLNEYCQHQPVGSKYHKRYTDRIAKSIIGLTRLKRYFQYRWTFFALCTPS